MIRSLELHVSIRSEKGLREKLAPPEKDIEDIIKVYTGDRCEQVQTVGKLGLGIVGAVFFDRSAKSILSYFQEKRCIFAPLLTLTSKICRTVFSYYTYLSGHRLSGSLKL